MSTSVNDGMIMRCVAYQRGSRIGEIALEQISDVLERDGTFVWLGLREPDDALLKAIQEEFGLHELAIEDTRSAHQRPKLEEYGDTLFIVLHTVTPSEKGVEFGETHLFVGAQFLVTVRHGESQSYQKVRERCEAMPQQLARAPAFALYAIMDFVVDNYIPVIDALQERFEAIETAIFQHRPSRSTMEQLYALKRELLLLQNSATPLIEICNELMRFHVRMLDQDVSVYFRDIADHVKRINQAINGMREMLLAAMQVHLTFETVRQNDVVKRLAGWGAILAIPTMVFSWYGMNFKHMPELDWEFGYPIVMGVVLLGGLALYLRLKRAGWL